MAREAVTSPARAACGVPRPSAATPTTRPPPRAANARAGGGGLVQQRVQPPAVVPGGSGNDDHENLAVSFGIGESPFSVQTPTALPQRELQHPILARNGIPPVSSPVP